MGGEQALSFSKKSFVDEETMRRPKDLRQAEVPQQVKDEQLTFARLQSTSTGSNQPMKKKDSNKVLQDGIENQKKR